jgi:hypothetical protein
MSTFGDLKTRIYNEIHQTMSTEVQNAVLDAVRYYQTERFWFNEAQVNFNLSLTSVYVLSSIIPKVVAIDNLKIWDGANNPYLVGRQQWDYIEEMDSETSTSSTPTDYAIHHESLRIYPKPSVTLSAQCNYHKAVTLSSSNSASAVWTNEAADLIRHRAKGILYATVLLDPNQAQVEHVLENQILSRLFARTVKFSSSNKVRGYL